MAAGGSTQKVQSTVRVRSKRVRVTSGGVIATNVYTTSGSDGERGEGHGRNVLLIHDFMTDKRLFRRLVKEPAFRGCTFAVPDLRGFGKSSAPTEDYSRSDDLEAVVRAAFPGASAVDVVGSGMGGAIGLQMALEKAHAVRSVSVLGSGMPGHSWSNESLMVDISTARLAGRLMSLLTDVKKDTIEAAIESEVTEVSKWKRLYMSTNSGTWGRILKHGRKAIVNELVTMARDYRGFHFFYHDPLIPEPLEGDPLIDHLASITQPVQVIVGDLDSTDFREIAYEIWERVPNRATGKHGKDSGIIRVENAGHFLPLEQPEAVARHVSQFWEAHSSLAVGE